MGVDIYGWVEKKSRSSDEWIGVLRIDAFVYRHKHGFGSMFLDEGLFQPIAKGRGLPKDMSEEVKRSNPDECWGHTWASWYEILTIDWEAIYRPASPRVLRYFRDASGNLLLDWHGYLQEMKDPPPLDFTQDSETDIGNIHYRVVHEPSIRRDETLATGWQLVFNAMRFIASQHDRDNDKVRLVVWFG